MALFTMGGAVLLLSLQPQAVVVGSVRNSATNEPLADAIVSMAEVNRHARVDSLGRYVFRQVSSGPQHIAVRAFGFSPRTVHALVPADGVLEINIMLVPDKVRLSTVLVRPIVALRGTSERGAPNIVDRRATIDAVRNNPMHAEPDLLLALSGGTVATMPESPRALHVRGGASDHVAYVVDGIPVFSPYHTAGVFSAWNPDAMSAVQLSSVMPNPGDPASLSGTVSASTRTPSDRLSVQGALSTTQARITADGPLGIGGARMMVSLRGGLPGLLAPRHEHSYVLGASDDRLGKIEAPLFGGQLRVLGFESADRITTSSTVSDLPVSTDRRNAYGWRSRSLGAAWSRSHEGRELRLVTWRAMSDVGASVGVLDSAFSMESSRDDVGMLASVMRATSRSSTIVGTRVEQSRTAFHVRGPTDDLAPTRLSSLTFTTTAFAQHELLMSDRTTLNTDLSLALFLGRLFVGPRARWQWKAHERLTLSSSYAQLHQFTQSLRNQESIAGAVFPAELYIGADGHTVPVAHSSQGIVSATYQTSRGLRVNAEAFTRRMRGMLLVAATNTEPFVTRSAAVGGGTTRGLGVDLSMSGTRYGMLASYALQRVRYSTDRLSYVPDHGALHSFDGGITVYPVPSFSIRVGVTGALGRRTTAVVGPFEWEACNLSDRGCEFGGNPRTSVESLGRATLPGYLRADLGVRKQWQADIGGRGVVVALFGAATNLTGRHNVLTYANDPLSSLRGPVEMRPRAPLVVGMEWRF